MPSAKCLIVDSMHESILDILGKNNVEIHYKPNLVRDEIKEQLQGIDILVLRSKTQVDSDLLINADRLKIVARAGSGVDNIDAAELESRNIVLLNAAEANRDAVGDHVLGMILCLLNNLNKGDREVRNKIWDREGNRGYELSAMTVGIIGYGNMGSAVATRLKSFGCRIIAYDKYKVGFGDEKVEEVSLDRIFEDTDILSLHVPLTEETFDMVNTDFINQFQKNIYLINAARGPVMMMDTALQGLDSGKIIKCGLDVLQNEKLETLSDAEQKSFNLLCKSDRVLFSPHVAGWSFESYEKISKVLAEKIVSVLNS